MSVRASSSRLRHFTTTAQIPSLHGVPLQQSLSWPQICPYSEHTPTGGVPAVPPVPAVLAPPLLAPAVLPAPPLPLPALPVGGGPDDVQLPTVEPGSR